MANFAGARARAFMLLLLTATLGASLGVMGDRLIAQQRTGALTTGEVSEENETPDVSEAPAVEPVDSAEPAAPQKPATPAPTQRTPVEPPVMERPDPMPGFMPPRPPVPYADRMFALLDLTPEQRLAVDSLMAVQQERVRELTQRIQPRFQAITRETQQEIQRLLTPDQRMRLRGLQQERNRLMKEGRLRPPPQQRQMQTREEVLRQLRDERMGGRQPERRPRPPVVLPDTGMVRR
jgi:hypothetical protein